MRIAIISDIHSNLPALDAVLDKITGFEVPLVYCLGDIVGYGPFPNECVRLVRERCRVVLKGNHDSGLVGETPLQDFNRFGHQAIAWSQKVITEENRNFLSALPLITVENGVTLAHSSPFRPKDWNYVMSVKAAEESFSAFTTHLCFIGHTHVPVIIGEDGTVNRYEKGHRYIINVGSVGQPRDGNPDAAFGVYDTDLEEYSLIRVPYDIQKTARAIRDARLPDFLAARLLRGI